VDSSRLYSYQDAFSEALYRYVQQDRRPGYEPTLFTSLRHSRKKYHELEVLEQALEKTKTREGQKLVLEQALSNSELIKKNNHSFRTYLLDVLLEKFPKEQWEKFDDKKLVFYQPDTGDSDNPVYLYRGSLQQPEDAFKNGMHSGFESRNIEDYAAVVNDNAGVSTSKSPKVADFYSTHLKFYHDGPQEYFGYVYQIHYRGNEGIDIDKTQRARNPRYPHSHTKQEVNIITFIPPEDIVGYGYVKYHDQDGSQVAVYEQVKANPSYQPDKTPASVKDKAALLGQVFDQEDKRSTCTIL